MLIERFDEIEKLDAAIDAAFTSLAGHEPKSDEYAKIVDQITKLTKIKEIIGNLKLKAFDSEAKKADSQSVLELKDRELQHKIEEDLELRSFRTNELELKEKDLQLKTNELEHKKTVHEDDRDLKSRELGIRGHDSEQSLKLKEEELALKRVESEKPDRVSADTWAMVGANLAGILLIVGYERVNVIASKAIGFVLKR